jgi:folate-dependent phosphoribosylglycinamide formyltransferase PurN
MQYVLITNRDSLLSFIKNKAKIYCEKNSYAHRYCREKKIKHDIYTTRKSVFKIIASNKNYRIIFNGLKYIVPDSVIRLCKYKIINLHPSILPNYKGQFPINNVYASKEKYIGATIHEVCSNVDSGKILSQFRMKKPKNIWVIELYHMLFNIELLLFKNFLKNKIKKYYVKKKKIKYFFKKNTYSYDEIKKINLSNISSYCVPKKFIKIVLNKKVYKILHIEKSNLKILNNFKNYKFLSRNHLLIKSKNYYYKAIVQ